MDDGAGGVLKIQCHESVCCECEVPDGFAPPERALTRIIRQHDSRNKEQMSARTLSLSSPGAASCHYEGPYKPLEASKRPVSMLHKPWLVDEDSEEYLFH